VMQAASQLRATQHSIIHVHTKPTKMKRGNCPLGKRWE